MKTETDILIEELIDLLHFLNESLIELENEEQYEECTKYNELIHQSIISTALQIASKGELDLQNTNKLIDSLHQTNKIIFKKLKEMENEK